MRFPVIVGVIGGIGAGKEAFSKAMQKHLMDKYRLATYILNESITSEEPQLSVESQLDQALDSLRADVVVVKGMSLLENEKLRSQLDFKIFLQSDSDFRLAKFVNHEKGKKEIDVIMEEYFTKIKPKDVDTQKSSEFADITVKQDVPRDKMNVLGLMISDLCHSERDGSSEAPEL